ncbi:sensor histidine kinase [Rhodoferax lacus]|nr:ATP-binding protein [Rhodoferax lacus]
MKRAFNHLSLSRQFLMVSFPVLLAGSLVIGWWIGRQVEEGVVHRIGSVTALYVDAFVGPHVQVLAHNQQLTAANMAMLNSDLSSTMLGQKIISLKVWDNTGRVLFSTDKSVIGKQFEIEEGLAVALTGSIFSEVSVRSKAEQIEHGQPMPRLIETYTPIHEDRTGRVIAVAEFYERPDELDRLAGEAQRSSWIRIAAIMTATYLCLFFLVRRGSHTIDAQQSELSEQVDQLTVLNARNVELQARVIDAAERATALNENFLARVSADIHDGPGQDLGFALMQLKNMDDACANPDTGVAPLRPEGVQSLRLTQVAIESALKDLRAMSADIELPDITRLELCEIAARVVRDLQVKTGVSADLVVAELPKAASYRLKVALYRLLQESLANTVRHAAGTPCSVRLSANEHSLHVEVRDQGPGFDPVAAAAKGRLGLRGMRQRVEVLGGVFELLTAPGAGTLIRVSLPLTVETQAREQYD